MCIGLSTEFELGPSPPAKFCALVSLSIFGCTFSFLYTEYGRYFRFRSLWTHLYVEPPLMWETTDRCRWLCLVYVSTPRTTPVLICITKVRVCQGSNIVRLTLRSQPCRDCCSSVQLTAISLFFFFLCPCLSCTLLIDRLLLRNIHFFENNV